jgi:hypothetical protein
MRYYSPIVLSLDLPIAKTSLGRVNQSITDEEIEAPGQAAKTLIGHRSPCRLLDFPPRAY